MSSRNKLCFSHRKIFCLIFFFIYIELSWLFFFFLEFLFRLVKKNFFKPYFRLDK